LKGDRVQHLNFEQFEQDNAFWQVIRESIQMMIDGAKDDLAQASDLLSIGRYQGEIEGYKKVLDIPSVLAQEAAAQAGEDRERIDEFQTEQED